MALDVKEFIVERFVVARKRTQFHLSDMQLMPDLIDLSPESVKDLFEIICLCFYVAFLSPGAEFREIIAKNPENIDVEIQFGYP